MEMLILLTVTDEEVFESFEIYLTRFKAKELELTILVTKALKRIFLREGLKCRLPSISDPTIFYMDPNIVVTVIRRATSKKKKKKKFFCCHVFLHDLKLDPLLLLQ
mgnify:CR=1 FL=1